MNDSDSDNSNMFKVDHSQQYNMEGQRRKQDVFFHKDKEILKEGQKRIVVYGTLEQQSRTVYQIVQPYFWTAARVTGQAATYAGKGIYSALANGASWIYDKFVNTVVPYANTQVPKLFFIIKNGAQKQMKMQQSETFHVLEIDQNDYDKIKKKQAKNTNKKRIIVPLTANEDPQFIKFLEKQKYVADTSFPIDIDSQDEDETFLIPSASFMAIHNDAIIRKSQKSQNLSILGHETQEIQIPHKLQKEISKQKQSENKVQPAQLDPIKSIIQDEKQVTTQEIEDYKKIEKKVFKLKDCYIFELEGKNSIEYDLLDGIEKDENTKCGFLVKSNKFDLNVDDDNSSGHQSGEAPLLIEKAVDTTRKVKVQIPTESTQKVQKVQQKQLEFA